MDEHIRHESPVSAAILTVSICVCKFQSCELRWYVTSRRGSFDKGDTEYEEIPRPVAYQRVLRTWGDWVDRNIDPLRTTVFFASMSPLHIK